MCSWFLYDYMQTFKNVSFKVVYAFRFVCGKFRNEQRPGLYDDNLTLLDMSQALKCSVTEMECIYFRIST